MQLSEAKAMEMGQSEGEKSVINTSLQADDRDEPTYPSLKVVIPVTIAVVLAVFLSSLVSTSGPKCMHIIGLSFLQDRTIIGVAIPAISNDFDSFGDISW